LRAPVAYDVESWSDFFVGAAGASAALTGLVFVAVSINLDPILAIDGLADRAFQTLLLLLGVVVISLLGLVPGQSATVLGAEFLATMLAFGTAIAYLLLRSLPPRDQPGWIVSRLLQVGPGTIASTVGGLSLLLGVGGGLYWTMAGIVLSLTGAVVSAWVLLIEIRR
jgi:modulator of FtsH protease